MDKNMVQRKTMTQEESNSKMKQEREVCPT